MILLRLAELYERLRESEEKIPEFGFQPKELPFIVVLEPDGRFAYLRDTREKEGKRLVGRKFLVPAERPRSGKNSWQVANWLWDHPGYLFGINPKSPKTGKKQHESFMKLIVEHFGEEPKDEGVAAVLTYLSQSDFSDLTSHELWEEIEKKMPFMSFQLRGDDRLVCQREKVKEVYLRSLVNEKRTRCLVTGRLDMPTRLHPKIKGVLGTQTSGALLVSFNESAYDSYGKKQGENAPVGEHAAFAYGTALNWLLSNERHRLRLGDTTVVFWAQHEHRSEDLMGLIFGSRKLEENDVEKIKEVFTAPQLGIEPEEEELPFYVLGLSPNAARISVRFWYEGSVGETLQNIRRYFDELQIVKRFDSDPDYPTLGQLLLSTALEHKWENVAPNLTGAFFYAILKGSRYPETLMASVLRRIRAEAARDYENVTYERAALLKALLIRNHHKEIPMSLDPNRPQRAYQLGRLFAVLEHLQSRAQGSLNATIRDRYYGSASGTPIAVFPTLLKLSAHHLAKLDSEGLRLWYEKMIGEILDHLDEWPTHLPLKEQALFALGYYHQKQALYTKKGDDHE
ncbi:type I-C CRISPR-associated protein Cas8c/Csd1 [Hydrogenimonas sp.]